MRHGTREAGGRRHHIDFPMKLFQPSFKNEHGKKAGPGRDIAGPWRNGIGGHHPRSRIALEAVAATGFSRFPVVGRDQSFIGYVHVKDVLDRFQDPTTPRTGNEVIHRAEIRPLTIVNASGTMDEALHAMHRTSAHMAQVRDRGELLGVVTMEDLIEEYLGTFADWTHEV